MKTVFLTAEKVWINTDIPVNVYADFTDSFNLSSIPENACINISADSNYLLILNDCVVGSLQYGDYPEYKVYDTYNVLPYLKLGENRVMIVGYFQGESSFSYKLGQAGIIYELFVDDNLICQSGKGTRCRINQNYISGEIERITSQLSFSFRYDATKKETDWQKCIVLPKNKHFYERPIKKLNILPRCPSVISAQGVFLKPFEQNLPCGEWMQKSPFITLTDEEMGFNIAHRQMPNSNGIKLSSNMGDGIYFIVDMLNETAGLLDFEIELPEETDIYIGFGEYITNLRIRTSIEGRQFAAVYHGKKGLNSFTHRFKRIAGRYLQIQILSSEATVYYAGVLPTEYPVEDKGGFVCGDTLHNKIYEVSKRTLSLCMHEHYEDCPWREQALYGMDSRIEMLTTYYAFKDTDFARESLRLMAYSQRENGQLELCAPADCPIYIPVFTLCFVIEAAEYLRFSSDKEFLTEIYPVLEKIIKSFSLKLSNEFLLNPFTEKEAWNFYEWSSGLEGSGGTWGKVNNYAPNENAGKVLSAPLNAYFSLALSSFAEICKELKLPNLEEIISLKEKVNRALSECFWNDEKGAFFSFIDDGGKHYSQLTQALLICCGAATKTQEDQAVKYLIEEDTGFVEMTLGSFYYKYEALLKNSDNYTKFVFSDIGKRWGQMLFSGATSFWETFAGNDEERFNGAGSMCHGWAALPIYFYYAYALGIKPGQKTNALDPGIHGCKTVETDK